MEIGSTTGRRLPGLDGVRAVAVLLVIWGHLCNFPAMQALDPPNPGAARLGVTVFFVLSGFLITTLLVEERARTGAVSLRDFYLRRTIRIFPAAWLYIGIIAVVASFGWIRLQPGDVLHALTYTTNYHHDRGWALGHLWSLAVEEQFYLLWPLAFLVAGRGSVFVAAAVVLLLPVLRGLAWLLWPGERVGIDEEFQYVADALATGCLLAMLVQRYGADRIIAWLPRWLFPVGVAAMVLAVQLRSYPSIYLPLGMSVIHIGIALSILWVVRRPGTLVGRLLESRPAVFLGTISYSLYLWQQLFLDPALMTMRHAIPIGLLLTLAAASASYYLVEKPLLRLRARFRH